MPGRNWALTKCTFVIWARHGSMRLAAATAFYTMMSLAPLLVVALRILSLKYGRTAEEKIGQQVNAFVGSEQAAGRGGAIHELLHFASKSPNGHLSMVISCGVALVSGSSLFVCVQDSLNFIWDVRPRRGLGMKVIVRHRIIAGAMVLLAGLLLLGSFLLSATLSIIVHKLGFWISGLSYLADTFASFVIGVLLFASIFKVLPDVVVDWPDVWFGAGVTGALFVLGKFGLTVYFRLAVIQNPYGAAGSLSALLIWIYYSAALMFLGASFTRAHTEQQGKPIRPNEYAASVPAR